MGDQGSRPGLGEYLRELRRKLGLSQEQVASRARSAGVDRSFVARLENEGLPGTVDKFLGVLVALQADFGLVADWVRSQAAPVRTLGNVDTPIAIQRIIAATEAGDFELALGWANQLLESAREAGDVETEANARLCLSIIARRQGLSHVARHHVEKALETPALRPEGRGKALVQLALVTNDLGLSEIALQILKAIPQAALKGGQTLRAHEANARGHILFVAGQYPESAAEFLRAVHETPENEFDTLIWPHFSRF